MKARLDLLVGQKPGNRTGGSWSAYSLSQDGHRDRDGDGVGVCVAMPCGGGLTVSVSVHSSVPSPCTMVVYFTLPGWPMTFPQRLSSDCSCTCKLCRGGRAPYGGDARSPLDHE